MKEFTFGPMNLWSMPRLYIVHYIETKLGSKTIYSTKLVPNPLYTLRSNG